ncbi:type I methionyl aminopeptidase [Candidatus Woesebacteria bacterium]|nr:type I methionyl aminopeptidase [Candidatus Woesebacteria bacterium]QQG47802.1 MAG: type I methionyl aminopeptidase [Candidatus Woesebacteria bacterium]
MEKINLKTEEEIKIMKEGGHILSNIKKEAKKILKEGTTAKEVDDLVTKLILNAKGRPSFQMVSNYHWATCINKNDGVVHGIPGKNIVFKKGDIVSVDLGIFYKGFHSDSAFSVQIGEDSEKHFLEIGKKTLNSAIKKAKIGKTIKDISESIENSLSKENLSPIRSLTGHGVGRALHEAPAIPCFVVRGLEKIKIEEGMVLAIEIMYTKGKGDITIDNDGWTIRTKDAKIAALFEESVAVTKNGPVILTN